MHGAEYSQTINLDLSRHALFSLEAWIVAGNAQGLDDSPDHAIPKASRFRVLPCVAFVFFHVNFFTALTFLCRVKSLMVPPLRKRQIGLWNMVVYDCH